MTMNSSLRKPTSRYPHVLSIAGSDSGGGAGIQADLKTFAAFGCFGMTAITAITVQNTQGVRAIHSIPTDIVRGQIDAVIEDIGADAVKIGMLHSAEIARMVAEAIERHSLVNVVFDPVMVATSGDRLIADDTVSVLVSALFPKVALITPNLDEAALLLGRELSRVDQLDDAVRDLLAMGARAVLLKGGHLKGDQVVDVFGSADGTWQHFESPRIESRNLHGTGCTLSSAIAAGLALGHSLPDSVEAARRFILTAIESGADVRTGHGNGPLNHGVAPQAMTRIPL
ncbi:MAG: Bifunctional hydroxymethylpyrimidine kinase/phosphomethylpyrimidine kinase [Rhizobacter sp.]|nr:Bifunctional hydroxymethylpyrimidine kinase/phosphomethylpyrimidine kinase [Rhizobacter sp.]